MPRDHSGEQSSPGKPKVAHADREVSTQLSGRLALGSGTTREVTSHCKKKARGQTRPKEQQATRTMAQADQGSAPSLLPQPKGAATAARPSPRAGLPQIRGNSLYVVQGDFLCVVTQGHLCPAASSLTDPSARWTQLSCTC